MVGERNITLKRLPGQQMSTRLDTGDAFRPEKNAASTAFVVRIGVGSPTSKDHLALHFETRWMSFLVDCMSFASFFLRFSRSWVESGVPWGLICAGLRWPPPNSDGIQPSSDY